MPKGSEAVMRYIRMSLQRIQEGVNGYEVISPVPAYPQTQPKTIVLTACSCRTATCRAQRLCEVVA